MDIMEIVLLAAGGIVFVLSFLIPARKEESSEETRGLAKEEIKTLVSEELEAVRGHVDDVVEEAVTYSIEKTERSLERLSNEKIMAVSEYSDTVLSEIHKNHEEVMFLYDMLNDKHINLKNTVSEINRTVKEAKETKKEAEEVVNTFQRLAPEAVLPLQQNNAEIPPVSAAAQRMNRLQAAPAASRGTAQQSSTPAQRFAPAGPVPQNVMPQRGSMLQASQPQRPAGAAQELTASQAAQPQRMAGAAQELTASQAAQPQRPAGAAQELTVSQAAQSQRMAGAAQELTASQASQPQKPAGAAQELTASQASQTQKAKEPSGTGTQRKTSTRRKSSAAQKQSSVQPPAQAVQETPETATVPAASGKDASAVQMPGEALPVAAVQQRTAFVSQEIMQRPLAGAEPTASAPPMPPREMMPPQAASESAVLPAAPVVLAQQQPPEVTGQFLPPELAQQPLTAPDSAMRLTEPVAAVLSPEIKQQNMVQPPSLPQEPVQQPFLLPETMSQPLTVPETVQNLVMAGQHVVEQLPPAPSQAFMTASMPEQEPAMAQVYAAAPQPSAAVPQAYTAVASVPSAQEFSVLPTYPEASQAPETFQQAYGNMQQSSAVIQPYGQPLPNTALGSETMLPGAINFLQEMDGRGRNYNDRIMELHKSGKSNVAIAKELNLGVGEVKLVIDLFKNRSEK